MPNTKPKRTPFSDFRVDYTPMRRVRRAKFELSMKDLARGAGCAPSTIYRIETNQGQPGHFLMLTLASGLGVPVTDLYEKLPLEPDGRS